MQYGFDLPPGVSDDIGATVLNAWADDISYMADREVYGLRSGITLPANWAPNQVAGAWDITAVNTKFDFRHYARYLRILCLSNVNSGTITFYITPYGNGRAYDGTPIAVGTWTGSGLSGMHDSSPAIVDLSSTPLQQKDFYYLSYSSPAFSGPYYFNNVSGYIYDAYEYTPTPTYPITGVPAITDPVGGGGGVPSSTWNAITASIYAPWLGSLSDTSGAMVITPFGPTSINCIYGQQSYPYAAELGCRATGSRDIAFHTLTHRKRYLRIRCSVNTNVVIQFFAHNFTALSNFDLIGGQLFFQVDFQSGTFIEPGHTAVSPNPRAAQSVAGRYIVDYLLDLHSGNANRYTPRSFGSWTPAIGTQYVIATHIPVGGEAKVMFMYETSDPSYDPTVVLSGYTRPPYWNHLDPTGGVGSAGGQKNIDTLRADLVALGNAVAYRNRPCTRIPYVTFDSGLASDEVDYSMPGGHFLKRQRRFLHILAPNFKASTKTFNFSSKARYWSAQASLANGQTGFGLKEVTLPESNGFWTGVDLDAWGDCPDGTDIYLYTIYSAINDHNG